MANQNSTGLEILSNILQFCDSKTTTRLIHGLQKDRTIPQSVVSKLRQTVILFEDLAYADQRGLEKLLQGISFKDLALALKGAPDGVTRNVASAMSQNMFSDLKTEIALAKNATESDINASRERILATVKALVRSHNLYIDKPDESRIY